MNRLLPLVAIGAFACLLWLLMAPGASRSARSEAEPPTPHSMAAQALPDLEAPPSDSSTPAVAQPSPVPDETPRDLAPRSESGWPSWLEALLAAARDRDESLFEAALWKALEEHPELGLELVELLDEPNLTRLERRVVLLALEATVALSSTGVSGARRAFGPSLEAQVSDWIEQIARGTPDAETLTTLLRLPGFLNADELVLLHNLVLVYPESADTLVSFIRVLLPRLGPEDVADIEPLLDSPHEPIALAALENLIRIAPDRAVELERKIVELDAPGAARLFAALCEHLPLDAVPDLLLRTAQTEPERLDWTVPLSRYAARTELRFFESIVYLRGNDARSESYRRQAIVAANMAALASPTNRIETRDLFRAIFEQDSSAAVRRNALLALGAHWPRDDARGFERFLATVEQDPEFEQTAETARQNFYPDRRQEDPVAAGRVHQRLRKDR